MFSVRFLAAHLVCVWVFATGVASALPTEFHQEGWVVDANGRAIEGLHRVEITLYDGRGQRLFSETHARVEFTQGYYSLRIGSIDDLDPNDFILDEVTVGISIDDGNELAPRLPLLPVPAALVAEKALDVVGPINPSEVRIAGDVVINARGDGLCGGWLAGTGGAPRGGRTTGPSGSPRTSRTCGCSRGRWQPRYPRTSHGKVTHGRWD